MKITKTKVIRTALLFLAGGVVTVLYVFLLQRGQKISRDMQRIADIKTIQSGFELLFQKRYTYAEAAEGCPDTSDAAHECALAEFLPEIGSLQDPGEFVYHVVRVPTEIDYAIGFTLEKGNGALSAGEHLLTPHGIE